MRRATIISTVYWTFGSCMEQVQYNATRRLWATDKIVSAYLCFELQVWVSQNTGDETNFME